MKQQAIETLRRNDRGAYTVPTAIGLYPAQWNWDSCLIALGWAQLDEVGAVVEIETLLGGSGRTGWCRAPGRAVADAAHAAVGNRDVTLEDALNARW